MTTDLEMNVDLCQKIAWSFHQRSGVDFDDLVQEAYYAWVAWVDGKAWGAECANENPKYDPKKSSLRTFGYQNLYFHLTNVTTRAGRQPYTIPMTVHNPASGDDEIIEPAGNDPTPDQNLIFKEAIRDLPDEVTLVLDIIFSAPSDYLSLHPASALNELTKVLIKDHGYSKTKARSALNSIRSMLKDLPNP